MRKTTILKIQKKVSDFLEQIPENHKNFYGLSSSLIYFSGPTLYFHLQSLNSKHCPSLFAKSSYAMLACWGMHRMGPKGPKMKDFSIYEKSLHDIWSDIRELQGHSLDSLDNEQWTKLRKCFSNLKIMEGDCILVGHSKVLAHLLPSIVPPIDRTHTLKFLEISITPKESETLQWDKFEAILKSFFLPILKDKQFQAYYRSGKLLNQPWATSALKCIDNLIIGAEKIKKTRIIDGKRRAEK
jgi:hypothetical protein